MVGTGDARSRSIALWQQRRFMIWSAAAVAFLTAYFHRTVIGVVADSLMREFAMERAADLGLLASIYFWTYAALQLPAGIMADVFGPRRVITLSLVLSAAGSLLFGLAGSLPLLYAGRFVTTLGIGLIFVCLIKLQAEWFRMREFATMSGLIVLIGNSGSLLSATPMALLVEGWGWRSAFYLIAVFSLLMAAACWVVVRDRPQDIGLPGVTEMESGLPPPGPVGLQTENAPDISGCIRAVLLNKATWPPLIAGTAIYGVFMCIMGVWGMPYLMQVYGLSRVDASQYILLMGAGNMVGAPLIGFVSDRSQYRRRPYVGAAFVFLAGLLALTLWNGARPPVAALTPICLSFGVGVSCLSLSVACVKEINPPYATGIAAGITNSGPFIGAAVMQPAFGWVLDQHWAGTVEHGIKAYPQTAYAAAFFLCVAVLGAGLMAALRIRETRCRQCPNPHR